MHSVTRLAVLVACFLGTLIAYPAYSQDGMKRTILNQADLSGAPGMEIISSILEVQPGTTIPQHFHNGIETGRVLEGGMIQYPGKEPQMLKSGTPIFNLRGAMHAGWKLVSKKPMKLYTVHVVDKGKPLFDGVK
jgi:quercetin dioxygenase-like cupin family protein